MPRSISLILYVVYSPCKCTTQLWDWSQMIIWLQNALEVLDIFNYGNTNIKPWEAKTGVLRLKNSNLNPLCTFWVTSWPESRAHSSIYLFSTSRSIKSLGAVLITNWAWCQSRSALRFAVADFIIKIEIHTAQTGFLWEKISQSHRDTPAESRAPKTGAAYVTSLLYYIIPTRARARGTSMYTAFRGHRVIISGGWRWKLALSIHEPLNNSQQQARNEMKVMSRATSGKKSADSLVDSSLPQWAIDKNKRAFALWIFEIDASDQWCKGLILIISRSAVCLKWNGHEKVKCGSKTDGDLSLRYKRGMRVFWDYMGIKLVQLYTLTIMALHSTVNFTFCESGLALFCDTFILLLQRYQF